MSHTFFIVASYGVSVLGLGLLAGWMILANRRAKRELDALEARRGRRRARAHKSSLAPDPIEAK